MKFKLVESNNLLEYDKQHSGQSYKNKKTKDNFLNIADKFNYYITGDLTLHHLDDTWTSSGYKDNSYDNVLFINASKEDADCLHKLLHYLTRDGNTFLVFIKNVIRLIRMPIYKYDVNKNKIYKLNIFSAFKLH